jgi:hypothetical protein
MARTTRPKQDATTEVVALLNQAKASLGGNRTERITEEKLGKRPVGRPQKRPKIFKDMISASEGEEGLVPNITFSLEASPFHAVPSSSDVNIDSHTTPSPNLSKTQASSTRANVQTRRLRNPPPRSAVRDPIGDESPQSSVTKRYNLRNHDAAPKLLSNSAHLPLGGPLLDSTNIGYPTPEKSSRTRVTRATSTKAVAPAPDQKEHTASKQAGKLGPNIVDQQSNDGVEQNGVEDDEKGPGGKGDKNYEPDAVEDKKLQESMLQEKAESASELHNCFDLWTKVWNAEERIQKSSVTLTEEVQEPVTETKYFEEFFQHISTTTTEGEAAENDDEDDDEDSLSESQSPDLGKITSAAMEKVKKDLSSLKDTDPADFRDELCRREIRRAVCLFRQVLIERAANGRLSMSALKELCRILTAIQVLCKEMLDLEAAAELPLKGIERSLKGIKLSSLGIEKKYRAAMSKFRTEKHNARARIREKKLADSRAREQDERRLRRPADRQNRVNSLWKVLADRPRPITTHAVVHEQKRSPRAESEVYDVDDLDLPDTTPSTTHLFHREATEDIPAPPKRLWRIEETLALSFLLLHYRDADRYERIHEQIGQFSRHIRQAGGENILSMTEEDIVKVDLAGDTLDELGNMDVAEIEEHANYLKAMQVGGLEMPLKNGGERDNWASLAGV